MFPGNLRYLRTKTKKSQQGVADDLHISRGQYQKYEDGISEAPYNILIKMSAYYYVTTDLLLTADLTKVSLESIIKLGNNRLLLPITVDNKGENKIEIVTHKTKAGYAAGGYADFQFISELDHIYLPWLGKNEKYRTFPIDGDSMPPHNHDSYIVGKYIEKLGNVIDGRTYIIITKNKEMVYKRLNKNGKNIFVLNSDSSFYQSYEVKFSQIAEIWEYAGSIERGTFKTYENEIPPLENVIRKLQMDIMEIRALYKGI